MIRNAYRYLRCGIGMHAWGAWLSGETYVRKSYHVPTQTWIQDSTFIVQSRSCGWCGVEQNRRSEK